MPVSQPPRIPGKPLLGNTLELLRDASGFLVEKYRQFGPAFRVNAFGQEYTVMAGQEALHFLMTVGEKHFSRATFYRRFARELGAREFVLGVQGARHRQLRNVMKLGFSRQVAEPFIPSMIDQVRKRAREWTVGQPLRVPDMMADLAFDAYSLVMAGTPLREFFRDAMVYAETIMRVGAKVRPPILLSLPRYRHAKRRVFSLMNRLLEDHRVHQNDPNREFDLFYALLDAAKGGASEFTDADIIATALYGFVGTLVYLNRVLAYLLYELLKDPRLREQMTQEVDTVLSSGRLTAQGLRGMSTLHNAYLETLRFHPVALGLPFLVEEDFEFAGSLIRKGAKVVLTPLPVHFSPDFYTTPNCFDSGRCGQPRHEIYASGAYAPFGFDGRVCAAAGLVEIITLATTAALLHTVDLRLEPPDYKAKTKLDPLPGPETKFTVRMTGLRSVRPAAPAPPHAEKPLDAVPPELSSPQWTELLSRIKTTDYQPGTFVIREGDVSEQFFIVVEGEVEVLKHPERGAEKILATLGPGEYFGEIGLLRKIPRTASVRARSALKTLVVDRETFMAMVAESDLVSEQIAGTVRSRMMASRLSEALPHLTRDQLVRFLPNFRMAQYAAGETIVHQGDPSDAFFVIASGRVEVVSQRPGGQDLVLQEMGTGEWFGEIGILLGKPRTATVRAATGSEAEVMVIGKDDFDHLMSESGPTQADVWLVLLRRFSALESALKNSSTEKFE